jgi:hypothetical protein
MSKDVQQNSEEIIENLVICVITETGKITWVISGNPTKNQRQQFQKVFAVTNKPSIVMTVMLFIEITILKLLNTFETFYRGDEH